MASERLSRLQKWILTQCHQRGQEYTWYNKTHHRYVLRRKSLLGYFDTRSEKAEVAVTRSVRNLFQKGFIDVASGVWIPENTSEHLSVSLKELEQLNDKPDSYVIRQGFLGPYTRADLKRQIGGLKRIVEKRSPEFDGYVKFIKLTPAGIAKAQELLGAYERNKAK